MLDRWDPTREMMSLKQAMDRLMEEAFVGPHRLRGIWDERTITPSLDVYETKDDLVIKASLPGVKSEDVDIAITGDTLTIKGEFKQEEDTKDKNYLRQERRYGYFSRELILPVDVRSEKAEANYENGILTLKLPKAEEAKPKQIKVKPKPVIEGSKK